MNMLFRLSIVGLFTCFILYIFASIFLDIETEFGLILVLLFTTTCILSLFAPEDVKREGSMDSLYVIVYQVADLKGVKLLEDGKVQRNLSDTLAVFNAPKGRSETICAVGIKIVNEKGEQ